MKCPDCQTELKQVSHKGVPFDECPRCRGRWFDRSQLRAAKDRTDPELRWLTFHPFEDEADTIAVAAPRVAACSQCGTQMRALEYRASGVTIYKCGAEHGVWLPHGEFEAIVRYLDKMVDSESASELTKDAVHEVERIGSHGASASEVRDLFATMKLLEVRLAVEHPRLARVAEKIQEFSPLK
jgi:Zn-finger nucleic acid-binding protein